MTGTELGVPARTPTVRHRSALTATKSQTYPWLETFRLRRQGFYGRRAQTAEAGAYIAPGTSFSDFMSTVNAVGAAPIITVNYGTGTPALAAAWAQAAAGDNVQYWEIGNETAGNGTYGANWEADAATIEWCRPTRAARCTTR